MNAFYETSGQYVKVYNKHSNLLLKQKYSNNVSISTHYSFNAQINPNINITENIERIILVAAIYKWTVENENETLHLTSCSCLWEFPCIFWVGFCIFGVDFCFIQMRSVVFILNGSNVGCYFIRLIVLPHLLHHWCVFVR